MSATTTPRPAVDREFMGMARHLYSKLDADDKVAKALLMRVAKRCRIPLETGKLCKPEMLIEAAREWRDEMPQFGRLKLEIENSTRRLMIRELRLVASHQALITQWTDKESCMMIIVTGFGVRRREFEVFNEVIASVSLHAMARRYQRSFDNSLAAIKRDCLLLAESHISPPPPRLFQVPVPGGIWFGSWLLGQDDSLVLGVRTFK